MTGTVTANAGSIGGWSINSNQLSAGNIRINATSGYIDIGSLANVDYLADSSTGCFANGDCAVLIKAGGANTNYIQFSGGEIAINTPSVQLIDGNLTISGTVSASVGNIGGWTIDGNSIKRKGINNKWC